MASPSNQPLNDSSNDRVLNDSSRSIREDFFRNNQDFVDKGLDTSFKTLNSNLFSTINSSFANFNNDYERKLDKNREVHEKAIQALSIDLKRIQDKHMDMKIISEKQEEAMEYLVDRIRKIKLYSRIFRVFFQNYQQKGFMKMKENIIVDKYFSSKRKRSIFNSWRNITNAMSKGRIKLKYNKIFNEKYNEIQSVYMTDIRKLEEILQKLDIDIKKEIEERRALSKLYDINMNKGVEVFVKETNALLDFNSSSKIYFYFYNLDASTPNERSYRQDQTNTSYNKNNNK